MGGCGNHQDRARALLSLCQYSIPTHDELYIQYIITPYKTNYAGFTSKAGP